MKRRRVSKYTNESLRNALWVIFKQRKPFWHGDCLIDVCSPKLTRSNVNLVYRDSRATAATTSSIVLECCVGPRPDVWHEGSHICGNARCINPEHLVWEPRDINVSRELCHNHKYASARKGPCTHTPRCIVSEKLTKRDILHRVKCDAICEKLVDGQRDHSAKVHRVWRRCAESDSGDLAIHGERIYRSKFEGAT